MGKGVFIFYLIAWICGHIFYLGETLPDALKIHGIGVHIHSLFLISYIIYMTPYKNVELKIFWLFYLFYEAGSTVFYSYIQLTSDFTERSMAWEIAKRSGSYFKDPSLFFFEHMFIPVMVVFVAWQIYKVPNSEYLNNFKRSVFLKRKEATGVKQ